MWTTRSRAWERALVAECEAFFSGRSAQYLDNQNRPVPAWAWLNLLAHGSEEDIAAVAAGESEPPRSTSATSVWRQALAFLAQAGSPPGRAPAVDTRSSRARAGRATGAELHEARRPRDERVESPDETPHQPTSVMRP
jgi:hypothetical protein